MNKGITILDAFKSLEDLDDVVIEQPKSRKKIKESFEDNNKQWKKVDTIDISGKDMYDRGQAYYYARTGDHVDYEGKRYEIVLDDEGGHKIGYSDTILLKDDDGHVIEVSKKDFIDGAMLLKEDVAMTEALDDYWVISDGKNPKNSIVYPSIENVDEFISKLEPGEKYWELLHYVNGKDTKVWDSKNGKVVESCELKEEPVYDMRPEYDSRKSFYGKAKVDVRPDGTQILYSYGTPVCKITKDGKATLLKKGYLGWASSQTTLRHVKEFLKQNGFETGSINDLRKMYPIEQFNEDLNEGMTVDLMDKEEAKEGKEYLESEEDVFEKVVDVDASTIEELKDSYIGNVILRCPACKTLFYKKPELLEKDETSGYYNVEEKCEHCGAQDGFELVGQVASMDVEDEKQVETTGKDVDEVNVEVEEKPVEETEVEEKEVEIKKPSAIARESLVTLSDLDELDEKSLNESISKYLTKVYENVKDFSITSCKLDEDKLFVEGVINFKSDKQKTTTFILKECAMTKGGKLRVIGLNEDFDKDGVYKFIGNVVDNKFVCESLSYKYKDSKESKKVIGKVRI